jgi:hypothetical protein
MVKSQTNQEQQEQPDNLEYLVENEEIGEALLLRCWNGVTDQVNETITINKNSGVRYPDMYIRFYDEMGPMDVIKKKRWLTATINPKTGEFHTLEQLKSAGVISDAEIKFFQGPFPRRELVAMTRHQTYDKKEFLVRSERFFGLSASGGVLTISADNIDFTKRIHFEPDIVPIDPEQPNGATARIVKVGKCMPGYETAQKIWLTPFTKRNIEAAMQKAQRSTESSLHGRISLAISKEGQPNELAVQDLDTWTNAPFDELWTRLMTPNPQININSKDLLNYVKSSEGSKEKHNQYG